MKVLPDLAPIDFFSYLEVGAKHHKGGQPILSWESLPILAGDYKAGEEAPEYLIVASDLQGLVPQEEGYQLMGEVLPTYLQLVLEESYELTEKDRIGVILAGDLYTHPSKRGASGEVGAVWKAFKEAFDWVAGVAGNHDRLEELEEEFWEENAFLLHQNQLEIQGLTLAGIGGIIGNPSKPQRTASQEYLKSLQQLLKKQPNLLILHETPDYPPLGYIGNAAIREVLEQALINNTTLITGHCHWEEPWVQLDNGLTIINTDARVLILEKETSNNGQ